MPMLKIARLLLLTSISSALIACSHVAGNIVPDNGPTMESIYDDLGEDAVHRTSDNLPVCPGQHVVDSQGERGCLPQKQKSLTAASAPDFQKLPNPELKLYILPHLAGAEGLPIPGYWTAFSAYPRTLYALPLATQDSDGRRNP